MDPGYNVNLVQHNERSGYLVDNDILEKMHTMNLANQREKAYFDNESFVNKCFTEGNMTEAGAIDLDQGSNTKVDLTESNNPIARNLGAIKKPRKYSDSKRLGCHRNTKK